MVSLVKRRSTTEPEVPLRLIPQAVASQIRSWGEAVHRISIVRTCRHHYNVTVRTKSLPAELVPRAENMPVRRRGRGCTG